MRSAHDYLQHVRDMVRGVNQGDRLVTRAVVDATCNAAANAHPEIEREIIAMRDECREILADRARLTRRLPSDSDFVSPASAA